LFLLIVCLTDNRYRFSASFLELLLRNGLQSPHRLLNTYIGKHAMDGPDDPYKHLTSGEPALRVTVNVGNFDWDRLKKGKLVLQTSGSFSSSDVAQIQEQPVKQHKL
jgi:hypothetical protein